MRLADGRHEGVEPLLDLPGTRVGEGVENKGVGLHLGQHPREFGLQLALPAVTEIQEIESHPAGQPRRPGHAGTPGRSAVGDARPEHHDPVAEGVRNGLDAAVAVDAQFQRKHLVPQGQVDQTGLFALVHILDQRAVVVVALGPAETGVDPLPVALDVEIETLAGDGGHVVAQSVSAGFPPGADRPAVGAENDGQAGGEGRVVLHGLPEFVTGGVDPLEQFGSGHALADDGQRRGIDVTERLLLLRTGGVQRQQQHGQREAAENEGKVLHGIGIWLYPGLSAVRRIQSL